MLSELLSLAQLRELAAADHRLMLSVPLDELPRLRAMQCGSDVAANGQGSVAGSAAVAAELSFGLAEQGQPEVAGRVSAELALECQRCLQPVVVPLSAEFNLLCFSDEEELDALTVFEQRFDTIVVGNAGIALRDVLEDEVLASLPLAPKHPDLRGCGLDRGVFSSAPEVSRPFAGLAGLLRPDDRSES